MSYPQNPPAHPEIGPTNSRGIPNRSIKGIGEIRFNQLPALSDDPCRTARAIIAAEDLRTPIAIAQKRASEAIQKSISLAG